MRLHIAMIASMMMLASGAANAQSVTEAETDGQAVNNSRASAQAISASSFFVNSNPDVFGTRPTATIRGRAGLQDVDFYSFSSPAGDAWFDIDGAAPGLDTYLALFDSNGTLLADSDDSFPADAGSLSDRDAFLGSITLLGGEYFIAVAASGNFANATFTGGDPIELFRPDGEFGGFAFQGADASDSSFAFSGVQADSQGYQLSISIVPAPSSAALLTLAAVPFLRRRR